ncbi:ROK family protein [Cognatishimia sp. SS12]|uniref:glucokinase n=1 Tax=Cognatishimia sp. SS12 TaxID=2979465 RepID=UPI00232E6DCC|nr:ROK family protein [Cognatishimia sp. SS12]MDC0738458.1 ROK family protein [Cognatishimia sp. SS12]
MTGTLLVADIGGTNMRVGLADATGLRIDSTRKFSNAEFPSFEAVIEAYVADMTPGRLSGACVGVAGPVQDGAAQMTNLSWRIDRETLRRVTGAPIADVINDLPAQGLALGDMTADSIETLRGGVVGKGPRLVVGLGTGFNIVPVHNAGDILIAPSCEAGHMGLPYRAEQAALCDWLRSNCGFPSLEVALAGQGIENIYRFHAGQRCAASEVMQKLAAGDDMAQKVMSDYAALLGAVIGDFCLAHLPFGGVFLTGGVARHVAPYLGKLGFEAALSDKGRFSDLARQFSLSLITDDFAALKGCARHLRQLEGNAA